MAEVLKEIGSKLKSTREAQGLELTDIAEILKIRRLYLDAIEKGDPAELPGLAYFEGYLKNYADMLGLDGELMLSEYQDYVQVSAEAAQQSERQKQAKVKRPKGKGMPFLF